MQNTSVLIHAFFGMLDAAEVIECHVGQWALLNEDTHSLLVSLQAKMSIFRSPQFDGPVVPHRSYEATAVRADISTHHFPFMACQGICHFEVMCSPQLYSIVKPCCHKVVPIIWLKFYLQTAQQSHFQLVTSSRMHVADLSTTVNLVQTV